MTNIVARAVIGEELARSGELSRLDQIYAAYERHVAEHGEPAGGAGGVVDWVRKYPRA